MAAILTAKFADYIAKVLPGMLGMKTLDEALNSSFQISGINWMPISRFIFRASIPYLQHNRHQQYKLKYKLRRNYRQLFIINYKYNVNTILATKHFIGLFKMCNKTLHKLGVSFLNDTTSDLHYLQCKRKCRWRVNNPIRYGIKTEFYDRI